MAKFVTDQKITKETILEFTEALYDVVDKFIKENLEKPKPEDVSVQLFFKQQLWGACIRLGSKRANPAVGDLNIKAVEPVPAPERNPFRKGAKRVAVNVPVGKNNDNPFKASHRAAKGNAGNSEQSKPDTSEAAQGTPKTTGEAEETISPEMQIVLDQVKAEYIDLPTRDQEYLLKTFELPALKIIARNLKVPEYGKMVEGELVFAIYTKLHPEDADATPLVVSAETSPPVSIVERFKALIGGGLSELSQIEKAFNTDELKEILGGAEIKFNPGDKKKALAVCVWNFVNPDAVLNPDGSPVNTQAPPEKAKEPAKVIELGDDTPEVKKPAAKKPAAKKAPAKKEEK